MYNYETEKPKLFTEQGQILFLKIRDNVQKLLQCSGAVLMDNAISDRYIVGDSWMKLACVDRMVELGEIREIKYNHVAGQYRVFVKSGL